MSNRIILGLYELLLVIFPILISDWLFGGKVKPLIDQIIDITYYFDMSFPKPLPGK